MALESRARHIYCRRSSLVRRKASSVVEAPAAVAYQRKHLANHVEVFETRAVLQLSKQQQVRYMSVGTASV